MNTRKEIPVLLLTGYLGSGKTTLLNRILSNRRGIRFAVIVNDIGEVNIDATLIQQGGVVNQTDDSLVALQNGCICCTLKSDLVNQLRDIANTDRFDYIVIEASGICEPEPIAQTLISIPTMADGFNVIPRLDCIVTVVDTLRLRDEFEGGDLLLRPGIDDEDIENLVVQQIEFCNIVLPNWDAPARLYAPCSPRLRLSSATTATWTSTESSTPTSSTSTRQPPRPPGFRRWRAEPTSTTTRKSTTTNTSTITTTTMRAKPKNTASAPTCTSVAALST